MTPSPNNTIFLFYSYPPPRRSHTANFIEFTTAIEHINSSYSLVQGAFCTLHIIDIICDRFQKINHFVSFDTLNIYSWNKALHNTNQNYCELSFTLYYKLPEILWNILIAVCIQLWQQGKVLVSIVFMHDKVVDFPKSGHICKCMTQ